MSASSIELHAIKRSRRGVGATLNWPSVATVKKAVFRRQKVFARVKVSFFVRHNVPKKISANIYNFPLA